MFFKLGQTAGAAEGDIHVWNGEGEEAQEDVHNIVPGVEQPHQDVRAKTRDGGFENELAGFHSHASLIDEVLKANGPAQLHQQAIELRNVAIEFVADELEVHGNFAAAFGLAYSFDAATDDFLTGATAREHPDHRDDDGDNDEGDQS